VNGEIGSETIISFGVYIIGKNDHVIDSPGILVRNSPWINDGNRSELQKVLIGRDVWIGAGSIILSGVEIGDGAIVAAGSVVTSDVESCTIVGGSPSRYIRDRFESSGDKESHLRYLRTLK
jgi:acetyltransferase-like isoleucine patch superfamily enzyme